MPTLDPDVWRTINDIFSFPNGPGWVLDFSDADMRRFFSNRGINIDDPKYHDNGSSKGKRLGMFLEKTDALTAKSVLEALWDYRSSMIDRLGITDSVAASEKRYERVIGVLAAAASSGPSGYSESSLLTSERAEALLDELHHVEGMDPHARGYGFEMFLNRLFDENGLRPHQPFSNVGEQIDGSFVLDAHIYLFEAKWRKEKTGAQELNAFHGKLAGKAHWGRGLFVSYQGFSEGAAIAFRGDRALLMSGKDIKDSLERRIPMTEVLRKKDRAAVETGKFFTPFRHLFPPEPQGGVKR